MSDSKTVFKQSSEFVKSLKNYKKVIPKLIEFVKVKSLDPMAKFGAKDSHFTGGGPLSASGVLHVHLTHDIQLLYRRHSKNPTVIEMLLVGSHDDFGTGQPPNIKKQKTLAKSLDNMDADTALALKEGRLPKGSYPAVTTGSLAEIEVGGSKVTIDFPVGIKGTNKRDTITVSDDGISSQVLGPGGTVKFS